MYLEMSSSENEEFLNQGAALINNNPMLTELPLIMAGGTFKSLSFMQADQLEKFLSFLVRYTCHKYRLNPFNNPPWWSERVIYHPEFYVGHVSLPYTRNKSVKLRRLIKLCYLHHKCKDLLSLSEKLAALHALSYKFVRNLDGTVTVMQVSSRTPIVMIPSSNLDYDLEILTGSCQRELTIIPMRKPLIAYDTKPLKSEHDEANNCIIIEDSSSDDDVEIVSYEKGAFPPTPPKKKSDFRERPGPACSKFGVRRSLSQVHRPPPPYVQPLCTTPYVQPPLVKPCPAQRTLYNELLRKMRQKVDCKPLSAPTSVPPPLTARRSKTVSNFLRVRNARPRRTHTFTFVDIDLTIDDDDDDDPEKKARLPSDIPKNAFLGRFDLLVKGAKLPECKSFPVVPEKKSKMFNLKNLSLDQVPFLVRMGILPKRCLCSQKELDQRMDYIATHTRKDFECSRVTVRAHDRKAVAAFTRKCYVRVKRLNSADLRKWRKNITRS